jgi:hypothetical protein
MKHRLSSLALSRISTAPRTLHAPLLWRIPGRSSIQYGNTTQPLQLRSFAITARLNVQLPSKDPGSYDNSNARPASELNHNITQEERDDFARKLQEDKSKQIRTPWHREGSDKPPVARQRRAGAMTKGTPSVDLVQIRILIRYRKTTHHTLTHAQDYSSSYDQRH